MAFEFGGAIDRARVEQVVREVVLGRLGPDGRDVPSRLVVHASARHMHVNRADLDALFGPGHELTPERPCTRKGTTPPRRP